MERPLSVTGDEKKAFRRQRQSAEKHGRANPVPVALEISLGGLGAVGGAREVDGGSPQRLADRFEILDRVPGGVAPQVGVALQDRPAGPRLLGRRLAGAGAGKRMAAAGSSLIDEHEIVARVQDREDLRQV
jgi:hypothetical protein